MRPTSPRRPSGSRRPARWWVRPPPGPRCPATWRSRRRRQARPSAMIWPRCPGSCRSTPTRWARPGPTTGSAYLREASSLMRGTLLPSASDIYTRESGLLTSASAQATGLPLVVIAIVIGLGIGYVFYRSSRWLAGHTHRVVNYGLLLAAVVGLVSLAWLAGAFVVGRSDLLHAQQQGSAPAQAFARADVAALQAHADESLTLIDNSGDDAYQQDFL